VGERDRAAVQRGCGLRAKECGQPTWARVGEGEGEGASDAPACRSAPTSRRALLRVWRGRRPTLPSWGCLAGPEAALADENALVEEKSEGEAGKARTWVGRVQEGLAAGAARASLPKSEWERKREPVPRRVALRPRRPSSLRLFSHQRSSQHACRLARPRGRVRLHPSARKGRRRHDPRRLGKAHLVRRRNLGRRRQEEPRRP